MKLSISETAKLSGVSVRTLHYYDEIGLLQPTHIAESGYRYYDEDALEQLQQILFYRELEFPLKEIKLILSSPEYDRYQALQAQQELLLLKKERLEQLISLVGKQLKGEKVMSFQEFDKKTIDETKKKYAAEAKERWGNTDAYKESISKTNSYSDEDWAKINAEFNQILLEFAKLRSSAPDSKEAQAAVLKWKTYITKHYYNCTDEILAGLGLMYSHDERFTKSIDQAGEGTAEIMSAAIAKFVETR